MIQKSFTAAMLDYFGKKPGQSNTEFLHEMKKLSDADKAYFAALLKGAGYDIVQLAA